MIRAILTDIEGTTSSLSFVKDVLFPYARERIGDFVRAQRDNPVVQAQLAEVRRLAGESATATTPMTGRTSEASRASDTPRDPRLDPIGDGLDETSAIAQLERWIDEDRKITPLKTLQGMIWEDGYRRGDFTGHIYDDAVRALRAWHDRGIRLFVYSSGSVLAQKLLFAHTAYGDLTPLFAGYFDTAIGGKREADSYRVIAGQIGLDPDEILFLSDIREELDAAGAAGMPTQWLVREGNLDPAAPHPQARDFSGIHP